MAKKEDQKASIILEFREALESPDWCDKAWLLAQALTALDHPQLHKRLVELRKQIMVEITKQIGEAQLERHMYSFKPLKQVERIKRFNSWKLIDITPEISIDPRVANVGVSGKLVKKLRQLIREQIWLLRQYE